MEGKIQFSKKGMILLSEVETFSGMKTHEEFYSWDNFPWDIIKGYQPVNGKHTENKNGELYSVELQLKSCPNSHISTIDSGHHKANLMKDSNQPSYLVQFRREVKKPGTQANEIMNFIKEKRKVKMYEIIAHILSKGYKRSGSQSATIRLLVVDGFITITGRGDNAIIEWIS